MHFGTIATLPGFTSFKTHAFPEIVMSSASPPLSQAPTQAVSPDRLSISINPETSNTSWPSMFTSQHWLTSFSHF